MPYLLRAHNVLTDAITEKTLSKTQTRKQWERQASELMQSMQDLGDDDFEGYIELIDTQTGEVIHKMNVSWPAQGGEQNGEQRFPRRAQGPR